MNDPNKEKYLSEDRLKLLWLLVSKMGILLTPEQVTSQDNEKASAIEESDAAHRQDSDVGSSTERNDDVET